MHKKVVFRLARTSLVAAVSLLSVTLHAASSANVAWDASASPNITAYTVRYGTISGSYPGTHNAGLALTATVTNLIAGTRYYFAVTARNSAGLESDPSNEVSYTPSATPPNVAPTVDPISNRTLNEDAGQQSVSLTGISAGAGDPPQPLSITASSSNPGLIPTPTVSYTSPNATGSLLLVPASNANGTATITVTVNDGQSQNNIVTRSFVVTVNAVNDPPTLNTLANLALPAGAAQQIVSLSGIGSGAANESQSLIVTATSGNTALIPTPSVTYSSPNSTGSLQFTPVAGASGTATLSVTVNDGQSLNNTVTRTFNITVSAAANTPPTLNALSNLTLAEDAAEQIINLSGITPGAAGETQTLSVTASSSNTGLIPNPTVSYTSPGSTGSVRLTPAANANGTATISVTVNDGQSQNNVVTRSFVVTVNAVNDPPTLNTLTNLALPAGAAQQIVSLSGVGSGAANESQTLIVTATSGNTAFIPTPTVTYSSPNSTGSLQFTPVAGATGTATLSVTVNDGQSLNNTVTRSFTVTVSGSTTYIEAETGMRVSPMTVGSDPNASNGQYVYSPRNNLGKVSIAINIPQPGTYWVWCRVRPPDNGKDSFFVAADEGAEEIFDTTPGAWSDTWQWVKLNGHVTGSERTFNWNAGTHTLTFRSRERSTFLDALYVTNDRDFNPAGDQQIVNLPAGSGTPTPEDAATDAITLATPSSVLEAGAVVSDLAIARLDARAVTLVWKTDKPATCLVNYRVPGADDWLVGDEDSSIEPATDHEISLTDLEPGTTYVVSVVSADFGGGISSTEAATLSMPPVSLVSWEAEYGDLATPMTERNEDTAVNGSCISSEADGAGTAHYLVEIPVTSDYRLWCRVHVPTADLGSIAVSLNVMSEQLVELSQQSSWRWVQIPSPPLKLESGVDQIFIRTVRNGMLVDELILSNDPFWTPGEAQ